MKAELILTVVFNFQGVRNVQPQVAEFLAQGLSGDPQQAGRLVLTPARVLKNKRQQESVHLAVRFRIEVLSIRAKPLANECAQAFVCALGWWPAAFTRLSSEFRQKCCEEYCAAGLQQGLLQDALQLPNITRPLVASQALQRFRGELANFPSKVASESLQIILGKQRQVVFQFAQWGKVDGDDAESIFQVRPER